MATTYKIHPAIGIARLGNSPDELFIGPERPGELPMPEGGFKDDQLRVKRQAARFRIFAHHDDGTAHEITDAEAEISWTVHVANKKAAHVDRGNSEPAADLTIDPGPRTATGPNQRHVFDGGTIRFAGQAAVEVPLGELRTDDANHLLVLGGFGSSASPAGNGIDYFWASDGWYDDISDGPVTASITLRATGETPAVSGAWVIVAPPKFAPHQDSVTTLYDRLQHTMIEAGLLAAPTTTSYTRDIYPILQRAKDTRWVYTNGNANWGSKHAWTHPVLELPKRQQIFARLRPASNMPELNGEDSALTATQHAHMERWKDDVSFVDDWSGPPEPDATITPAGLDRAALEACVGGAFYPGIEAGGRWDGDRPITTPANYAEPFRLNHAVVGPGDISASMALPWQADFLDCAENWWPVPRPNAVIPQGQTSYLDWTRNVLDYDDMVERWHTLGFVVKQGDEHVEVETSDTAWVTLLTPYLQFEDVPQGPLGMVCEVPLAIELEVASQAAAVTLEFTPGGMPAHPQLFAATTSVTVGPTPSGASEIARLWIVYSTGDASSAIPTQVVTVREVSSGREWSIEIDANTVARKTAAVALVLDRSGSMAENRGDGQSKHAALQTAAETFVDLMLEGDAVGLVRYNDDAQPVQPLQTLGKGGLSDVKRRETIELIRGDSLDPQGATSIGDGIFEGRKLLDEADPSFDVKSLVVLTDGKENRPRYIADVAAEIDARTYAIGLGKPQNTSAVSLQTIARNHGGYLLVTGAITRDNAFVLQKHFLQILAGISNAEVFSDLNGRLVEGAVQRIPFLVSEADAGIEVVLLSGHADSVDIRLQAPSGRILEPWRARVEPTMRFDHGPHSSYFRVVLPAQLLPRRFDREGIWHVLLKVGKPQLEREQNDRSIVHGLHAVRRQDRAQVPQVDEHLRRFQVAERAASGEALPLQAAVRRRSVAYGLRVHAYSSVSLQASLEQASHEPGARVSVQASLTQSGLPMPGQAAVWAEVIDAKGARSRYALEPVGEGRYAFEFAAAGSGVHVVRVRGRGRTRKGLPFVRERELHAVVWRGADRSAGQGNELLELMLSGGAAHDELEKQLLERGLDLERARKRVRRVPEEG